MFIKLAGITKQHRDKIIAEHENEVAYMNTKKANYRYLQETFYFPMGVGASLFGSLVLYYQFVWLGFACMLLSAYFAYMAVKLHKAIIYMEYKIQDKELKFSYDLVLLNELTFDKDTSNYIEKQKQHKGETNDNS